MDKMLWDSVYYFLSLHTNTISRYIDIHKLYECVEMHIYIDIITICRYTGRYIYIYIYIYTHKYEYKFTYTYI